MGTMYYKTKLALNFKSPGGKTVSTTQLTEIKRHGLTVQRTDKKRTSLLFKEQRWKRPRWILGFSWDYEVF